MNRQRMATVAATLSAHLGGTTAQMERDVKRVGKAGSANGISQMQAAGIVRESVRNNYVTLHRFQNEAHHNTPKLNAPKGINMAQNWGKQVAQGTNNAAMMNMPRNASDHTQGQNRSQFVSLTGDLNGLHNSTDPWARRITRGSNQLHEYTIPKRLVRDAGRISKEIDMTSRIGWNRVPFLDNNRMAAHIQQTQPDNARKAWLSGVPAQEKEVLYMGSNLSDYRTRQMANPYKNRP